MEQQYQHDYEEIQCIGRGAYGKFNTTYLIFYFRSCLLGQS